MAEILFYSIIIILLANFGLERYLAYLNIQHSKKNLPDILSDIYDANKYAKQQDYFRTNSRFGMLTSSFSFVIILLMYSLGGFGWLDQFIQTQINNEIFRSLVFFWCFIYS